MINSWQNVAINTPEKATAWRKISMGSWKPVGDSCINLSIDLPTSKFNTLKPKGISLNHFFAKVIALSLKEAPSINSLVRWGRIYPRKYTNIFFHVLTDKNNGEDLSGICLEKVDQKDLTQIAKEFNVKVKQELTGPSKYCKIKKLFKLLPGFLSRTILNLTGFIVYHLNIPLTLFGVPKDSFSAVQISNVGQFSQFQASQIYIPLAPYTRVNMAISVGSELKKPVINEKNEVVVAKIINVGFTIDHRVADGFHIAKMVNKIHFYFNNPQEILQENKKEVGNA